MGREGMFVALIREGGVADKWVWIVKDFSEGQFYGGFFAGLGLILGGFAAWRLDVRKSRLRGFDIVYGLNIWPWILASQILAIVFSIFCLRDRKSTRLNSSHDCISYAVFCLKKKNK